jgi:hypothetical protein
MTVTPLTDATEYIRKHIDLFFRSGTANALECATCLASDAFILGATETRILRRNDWWLVAANCDWLSHETLEPATLFARMIPFPQAGPNSIRSEILVGTFALEIALYTETNRTVIRGPASAGLELTGLGGGKGIERAVGFRFPEASP